MKLEAIRSEVKQILPEGLRRHRRADSTGSTASSWSNPLREEKLSRSNTQRARSQLLETHLAKLFKQKVEFFTKVDFTQESVLTTVVKLCLKSLQEFVRLQQSQLDIQFLRTLLKELAEDEAAIDFLLDEVVVAAAERCLDPTPLEPHFGQTYTSKVGKDQGTESNFSMTLKGAETFVTFHSLLLALCFILQCCLPSGFSLIRQFE